MGYSKITEVEVFNFMSFAHARVVFDETNILNLKGYNDSGKSALLRAVQVCLADMYKRAQTKYIRYGSDYFRVVVSFDDGISILRDKYMNGQSLYEMYKDGKIVFTTQQGNRLTRIDGVPKTIEKYLGLCVTENGCLNFQSCSDKLLLVETTGSENYQELNSVLKSNEISRATALINSDRNAMHSRMIEMENEYNSNQAVLKSRSDVDEDIIALVQERDQYSDALGEEMEDIKDILKEVVYMTGVELIPEVPEVETEKLADISDILGMLDKYSSFDHYPVLEKVEKDRLSDMQDILGLVDELSNIEILPKMDEVRVSQLSDISVVLGYLKKVDDLPELYPSVEPVSDTLLSKLEDLQIIKNILGNTGDIFKSLKDLYTEDKKLKAEMDLWTSKAKEKGVELFKCPHCGTYSEIPHTHEIA